MGKLPLAGLLAAIVALPTQPQAEPSLGLRVAYAVPSGDALGVEGIGSFTEKDLFKAEVPIQVDLSWELARSFSVGVYYSYSFARAGSQLESFCDAPGASCSKLREMRFGAQLEYDLARAGQLDPWVALGTGMAIAHFRVDSFVLATPLGMASGNLDGTLRGWEWLNAQIGVGWRLSRAFSLGPYVQYAIGRYTVQDIELAGEPVASGGIDNPKTHQWFTVGLRGKLGP